MAQQQTAGSEENLPDKRPVSVERKFGGVELTPQNERATEAAVAQAKALIEARFIMALRRPRDPMAVRDGILTNCKRLRFAEVARYMKEQRGAKACGYTDCPKRRDTTDYRGNPVTLCDYVCGPSIRFADEAAKCMGNLDVRQDLSYEDEQMRTVLVSALDLEANLFKSQTVNIRKTVERRKLKQGQRPIAERQNSYGELVYIVEATEDEVSMKEANLCARARRNQELQLIPGDIIEDAMDQIRLTIREDIDKDPAAAAKKVCDAFSALGVKPAMLAGYLQHDVLASSPAEIEVLRKLYASIKDGQTTWAQVAGKSEGQDDAGKGGESKLAPGRRKPAGQKPPEGEKPPSPLPPATADQKKEARQNWACDLRIKIAQAVRDDDITRARLEFVCGQAKVAVPGDAKEGHDWLGIDDERIIAIAHELGLDT